MQGNGFLDPASLWCQPDKVEEIEKASLRMIVQAIYSYRDAAEHIFRSEDDLVADIGEDVTREALDRLGMSTIDRRLFGKVDFKRARCVFHSQYAVRQALFVDSKAEKVDGQRTAALQTSQISMQVRQVRAGEEVNIPGKLPPVYSVPGESFLTTTVFVKYNYEELGASSKELRSITVAALPNGMLQDRYNPDTQDGIWLAGRNAPTLGEEFRVRLSFERLSAKCSWRVQRIPSSPDPFVWAD